MFDVNGWDLGKVLKLLLKGNAVAIEWLMSPIVYRADEGLRDDPLTFAERFVERARIVNHYRRLGERQRRTYFADGKDIALKKLFYALRPAAALRWLRLHPEAKIAPMHFPTLMTQCEPPEEIAALVDELIVRKAVTRELGDAPLPAQIDRFIEHELALAAANDAGASRPTWKVARGEADLLFRRWVRSFDAARP